MEKLKHYSSFEELKDSSKPIDQTSARSMERHDRFADALSVLRSQYVKSKASSDNNTPVSINTVDGL